MATEYSRYAELMEAREQPLERPWADLGLLNHPPLLDLTIRSVSRLLPMLRDAARKTRGSSA